MIVFAMCLVLSGILYVGAVLFLLRGLSSLKQSGAPQGLTWSVVIAARNEERNIASCLDTVLAQSIDASRYEVIVVDDRSRDATPSILADYAGRNANLRVVTITDVPAGVSPKKNAVSQGVAGARNEIIVLTDADCHVPPRWLETIDRNFAPDVGLLQGITTYERVPGMNAHFFGMQAIDFLSHGVVAAAAIGAGLPINSNANNLAFRKEAFDEVGGYGEGVAGVVSGDDDLLLQRIWKSGRYRVRFMADRQGAVTTLPTTTLRGIFEQRKRWGSKTVHYGPAQVAMLGGVFAFYLATAVSLVAGLVEPLLFPAFAVMLAVKCAGESLLMIPGTKLFGQTSLRPYLVPATLVQLPTVLLAVVLGVFGKFQWKEQVFARRVDA